MSEMSNSTSCPIQKLLNHPWFLFFLFLPQTILRLDYPNCTVLFVLSFDLHYIAQWLAPSWSVAWMTIKVHYLYSCLQVVHSLAFTHCLQSFCSTEIWSCISFTKQKPRARKVEPGNQLCEQWFRFAILEPRAIKGGHWSLR